MQMLFEMQEKALLLCTKEWDEQRDRKRPYLVAPMSGALVRTVFGNLLEEYQVVEFVSMFSRAALDVPDGFDAVLALQTRFLKRFFKGDEYLCFAPIHPSLVDKDSVHLAAEARAQLAEQLAAVPGSSIDDFTPEWPGNGSLLIVKNLEDLLKSLARFKLRDEEEFITAAILLSDGFIRSDDIGSMVIYYNEDAVLGVAMTDTEKFFALEEQPPDPPEEKSGEAALEPHFDDGEEAVSWDRNEPESPGLEETVFWKAPAPGEGAEGGEPVPEDAAESSELIEDMDKTMPVTKADAGWKTAGYGMADTTRRDADMEEMEKTIMMRRMEKNAHHAEDGQDEPLLDGDDAIEAVEKPKKGRWNPFARRSRHMVEDDEAYELEEEEQKAREDTVSQDTQVLPRKTTWSRFDDADDTDVDD